MTLPLFLLLFAFLPKSNEIKDSQKQVLIGMILPCALLQVMGPLILAGLYLSIPPAGRWLQSWIPSGDLGDVLVRSSMGFMLLGSWAGTLWLSLLWRSLAANEVASGSRLLPSD